MIPQELFDELPRGARHKIAAGWERVDGRVQDYKIKRRPIGPYPPTDPRELKLRDLNPSILLSLTWSARDSDKARADLRELKELLRTHHVHGEKFSGVEEFDPEDTQKTLGYFAADEVEERGMCHAEFYVNFIDQEKRNENDGITHMNDFIEGGTQWFELRKKWNNRGVRCMLVRRWVPSPKSWGDEGVISYWTGYVYAGEMFNMSLLPERIGTGSPVPLVTYPESYPARPDDSGWIGWDNNIEEDANRELEEPHMTEEDAVRLTDILSKAVSEVWMDLEVDAEDMYRESYTPPWIEEDEVDG